MLLNLYIVFLKIGLWGFGGGYAMLALIQSELVVRNEWLTNEQFTNIVAISQITPGPIAVNCATYVGYEVSGSWLGSLVATLGVVTPSLILMSLVSVFFTKLHGNIYVNTVIRTLRPFTIALILSAALLLVTPDNFIDFWSVTLMVGAFVASYKKVNPVLIILSSAILGFLIYYVF